MTPCDYFAKPLRVGHSFVGEVREANPRSGTRSETRHMHALLKQVSQRRRTAGYLAHIHQDGSAILAHGNLESLAVQLQGHFVRVGTRALELDIAWVDLDLETDARAASLACDDSADTTFLGEFYSRGRTIAILTTG